MCESGVCGEFIAVYSLVSELRMKSSNSAVVTSFNDLSTGIQGVVAL